MAIKPLKLVPIEEEESVIEAADTVEMVDSVDAIESQINIRTSVGAEKIVR